MLLYSHKFIISCYTGAGTLRDRADGITAVRFELSLSQLAWAQAYREVLPRALPCGRADGNTIVMA